MYHPARTRFIELYIATYMANYVNHPDNFIIGCAYTKAETAWDALEAFKSVPANHDSHPDLRNTFSYLEF